MASGIGAVDERGERVVRAAVRFSAGRSDPERLARRLDLRCENPSLLERKTFIIKDQPKSLKISTMKLGLPVMTYLTFQVWGETVYRRVLGMSRRIISVCIPGRYLCVYFRKTYAWNL